MSHARSTKFKVVTQPNSWSCYACVAAMATGKTLQDVVDFVGHDGSDIDNESPHPDKRRGFSLSEINRYIAEHGITFGVVGGDVSGFDFNIPKKYGAIEVSIPTDLPAMVLVRSSLSDFDGNHCLYWDGKRLYDPYYNEPVKFEDYTLNEWWPVAKIFEHNHA